MKKNSSLAAPPCNLPKCSPPQTEGTIVLKADVLLGCSSVLFGGDPGGGALLASLALELPLSFLRRSKPGRWPHYIEAHDARRQRPSELQTSASKLQQFKAHLASSKHLHQPITMARPSKVSPSGISANYYELIKRVSCSGYEYSWRVEACNWDAIAVKQHGCLSRLLKLFALPQVQALFKQTHAFFKENAQVKANMCKNHNLAAPQEYQPQAQTFFEQTHAFFKENAQVKANMCKNQTLAAPQEYQPLESGPVVSKGKHSAKAVGLLR